MTVQDEMSSIYDSITSIFNNENYLLNRLNSLKSAPNMHQVEISKIEKQLQELEKSRKALLDIYTKAYDENSDEVDGNKIIKNKAMVIGLLNEEMEQMKHNLKSMNQTKLNKKRLIQIYNYEKSKYYAKIEVLKLIGYTMLGVLLVFILKRLILPHTIAMGLASIIIAIGTIYVLYKMYDISIRDPLHFDKYIQPIDASLIEKEAAASYSAQNDDGVSDEEQIANLSANKCGNVIDNASTVTT